MAFKSDIEIAQEAKPLHIDEIAAKVGLIRYSGTLWKTQSKG